jgi:hypothetical protein
MMMNPRILWANIHSISQVGENALLGGQRTLPRFLSPINIGKRASCDQPFALTCNSALP